MGQGSANQVVPLNEDELDRVTALSAGLSVPERPAEEEIGIWLAKALARLDCPGYLIGRMRNYVDGLHAPGFDRWGRAQQIVEAYEGYLVAVSMGCDDPARPNLEEHVSQDPIPFR